MDGRIQLTRDETFWRGRFQAMGSPCEVLVDTLDEATALRAVQAVAGEAWRVERKFSRYRDDNIVHAINTAQGRPVEVDEETTRLLDMAATCYLLSEGLFDITSGVLRRVWRFDGSDHVPSRSAVSEILRLVGWSKVSWHAPRLQMPPGMEIDFGGIGKEYAVDRAASLGAAAANVGLLVNFGGDIVATGPRDDGRAWDVEVEDPGTGTKLPHITLRYGAVTTSGDARRFLLRDGVRYGHILDPRDGWPVRGAPRSVTVLAPTCTEAGLLSTLAILQGPRAEKFLRRQKVDHYIIW